VEESAMDVDTEANAEALLSPEVAKDPLSFLMAQQIQAPETNAKEEKKKNSFVDAEASEEEDVYDYGSDEDEANLDGDGKDLEELVDKEPVEMTEEQIEAGMVYDNERAEADDEKRIKEMMAVTRGERRNGRRGQYRRAGMREGLLEEEEDDSSEDDGDDDDMSDAEESESDGEAILGTEAAPEEADEDDDDWGEEKRRRLRLRRERLRRQELSQKGLSAEELLGTGGGSKRETLLQIDECSKDVWGMVNKTNVSRTASLSRTASTSLQPDESSKPHWYQLPHKANALRRHGSFRGLSAAKREKAVAMVGNSSSLLSSRSFVFAADDSCSNFAAEDTSSNIQAPKQAKAGALRSSKGSKPESLVKAGHQLFRSLSV